MNVALNVKCRQISRTGVESPYSLFLNRKGFSYCSVNRQHYQIETDTFLFTQPGDIYDLTVDNPQQTEICNIHINREFFNNAAYSFTTSSARLLDEPESPDHLLPLFTGLNPADTKITGLINHLVLLSPGDTAAFELLLIDVITNLALASDQVKKAISNMPCMQAHVRKDIYKRLSTARDHIHSNYQIALNLDEICIEAGMSKFHFLRMFKSLYGLTPYQYLLDIKMKKAAGLLEASNMHVNEIANLLGFEYPNSFIKAFKKMYGRAPLQYRHGLP